MPTELISAGEAKARILAGNAPSGMQVEGHLDFTGSGTLQALPPNLTVRRLTLDGVQWMSTLPAGLRCYELSAMRSALETLPDDLEVEYRIDLSLCGKLARLPTDLKVGSLVLSGCVNLESLPEGLDVYFLNISGCTKLTKLPDRGSVNFGRLVARGCSNLRSLPSWLTNISQLDVSDCVRLTELPEGLWVSSWIDLAHTQIEKLPASMAGTRLRWRNVMIDERIFFHPETITAEEILNEQNSERRRVLLERKGNAEFMKEAQAEVLDQDQDPGGTRRLLRVPLQNDEPLVCVEVLCPSTGRQYLLRVPSTIRNCHQAAAWIAGFTNPDDYHPLVET